MNMNKIQRILFTFAIALVVTVGQAATGTIVIKVPTGSGTGTITAKVGTTQIAASSTEDVNSPAQTAGTRVVLETTPGTNSYLYSLRVEPTALADIASAPRRSSEGPTLLSTIPLAKAGDGKYSFVVPADIEYLYVYSEFRAKGDLSGATVTLAQSSHTYDFLYHTPKVSSVTLGSVTLTEGTDYTVSGNDPVKDVKRNATTEDVEGYTITVTGKGKYTGSASTTYTVSPRTIADASITLSGTGLSGTSFIYLKNTIQKAEVIGVYVNGQSLGSGTDYQEARYYVGDNLTGDGSTYEDFDSENAGTYTIVIKGKGNFDGTTVAKKTYTINQKNISTCTVVTDPTNASFIYDGSSKTLGITVEDTNGNDLTAGAGNDYTVSGNVQTDVGGYTATVTANNINYTGSVNVPFTINVSNDGYYIVFESAKTTYYPSFSTTHSETYTGGQIELTPGTNIYVKKKANPTAAPQENDQVLSSSYYTLVYNNNINVGTATVTAIGRGGYNFTAVQTFEIVKKSISGVTFTLTNTSLTYNTSEQKPTVTIKDGTRDLVEGTDYTFSGQTNAGTYTVTITGIGNYKETATSASENSTGSVYQYTINTLPLTGADITLSTTDYVYDGNPKTPTVQQVKIDGIVIPSTDYTVGYSGNTYVNSTSNTPTVTIEPRNIATSGELYNLSGSASTTFTIAPRPISDMTISLDETSFTYNGLVQTPTVTITGLTLGTDYTLSYSSHDTDGNPTSTDVGTYTVTITGQGNYTGSINKTYVINQSSSDNTFVVTVTGTYTYNGSAYTPEGSTTEGTGQAVVVKKKKGTTPETYDVLTPGTDYSLSYRDNTDAGSAKVTATGKGNYQFVQTGEFTINPKTITDGMATLSGTDFDATNQSFVYNGALQKPIVTITDADLTKTLIEGTDYTLVNAGGTNVGTSYNATITGKGNYTTGTTDLVKNYSITALSLTGATVTLDPLQSYVYDGTEKRPGVQQVKVGNVIVPAADYNFTYPRDDQSEGHTDDDNDNVNAGVNTAKVYINPATTNLSDSKTQTFSITKKPLTSEMITLSSTASDWANNSFVYNGTLRTPTVTVSDIPTGFTTSIIQTSDYTITNAGGTEVGVYYVTVEATDDGNYSGTIKVPYSIVSDNSETDVTVTLGATDNLTYTGNPITRTITVTKGTSTTPLTLNTDYEVVYNNNINVGQATITILGKGNYHFVKYANFNIAARTLEAQSTTVTDNYTTITISPSTFEYNGSVQKPNVTVKYTYKKTGQTTLTTITLKEGTDYTLSNPGATNVGTEYKAVVTGIGNFTGTMDSPTYEITAKALTDAVITLYPLTNPVYDGNAKEPAVQSVTVGGQVYTSGYTVSYSNNINAGTNATVTVSSDGTSTFSGSASTTFTINPKPLADDMVVLAYTSVAYDGTAKEPGVTVTDAALPATFASKVLTLGTDYTLSYTTDHTTPGDKAASIIGKGNYIGTISKPYTIVGASGVDIALSDPTATFTYNGSAHTPAVTVTKGSGASKVTLAYGTDYSVAYSDNIHAGTNTAYITVTGKGNYDFTQTKTFSIAKKEMTNAMVTLENNTFTYDGNLHKPTVTVSDGTPSIITSSDYTISNDGNINAGDYTVTVTATSSGNYSGSGSKTYTINPLSISSGEVNLSYISTVFNGSVQKPTVQTVYANGHQLTATTDYTVTMPVDADAINQGAKTVTVTGKGNYKDSKDATYTIEQKEVTSSIIKIANENLTYTGSAQTAVVTIEDLVGSTNIITSNDYTLTNPGGTEVGNYTVSIVGKGNYKGSAKKQYSIIAQGATGFTVDEITETFTYKGAAWTPAVTVKKAGTADVLTLNTDYTVAYTDNTNVGTATVTVTGKGNYSGTRTVNFTITAKTLADGMVALSSTSFTYTGSEQKPVVTVTDMDTNTPLTLNTDYQVIYPTDPISQGTKTITVKGIGNYTGEVAKTYSIGVLSLNDASVTLNELSSYVYDGMEKKPTVKEVLVGTLVVPVTGYTVTYPDDLINIGTKTMTITGKGNYTGSTTKSYVVTPKTVTKEMISLSSENLIYTGSTLKPTVTVKDGAKTLTEGTDYTLSNDGGIEVGTYSLTITGMGNYTGTASRTYNIITKGASVFSVSDIASVTYNGSEQEPEITVVDNSTTPATTLTKGTHYTVAYSNNRNVGLASVTVTGIGSYAGTVSKTFTITPKTLTGAMVTLSATSFVFNSIAQKPEVTIDDKNAANVSIITDNDYTILNNGGINVGDGHEVKVTGKGNYTGTVTKTYAITPLSIATADVTLYQLQSYVYDATAKKPGVREVMVGHVTVPTTGYDVSYGENTNVGTAKVTVTGKGNFKDARTVEFTITGKPITSDMMVLSSENFVYNGGVQKPSVTVKDGSKTLTIGSDYTLTNEGGTSVGNYSVTVAGKGNYTSEASRTYSIVEKDGPTNFTISLSNTSVQYDGSEQKPSVTVTDGTKTLTIDTDYEVSYTNHVNVGTATVTVTGKGNYAGTKTATFTITAKPLTETMVTLSATTFVYNTYLQKPEVTVSDGSLMTGTDYVITNNGGTNQGTYHVIVNGQGNYSGQIDKTFSITPLSIADASVTLYQLQSYVYEGVQKKPGVREVAVGSIIVSTQGYTTTYGDNINAGTATVTVTGQGNYQDTKTVTFDIEQKAVENSMITLSNYEYTYNGEIQKPEVIVRDGETTLVLDTDYTLQNNGGKTVGAYDVIITGKGNYKGTASKTYIINAKEVGSFEVTLSAESVIYNGSEQQPEVTVKDGETVLTPGVNYTVAYTDNVNVGMATVTVRGLGEYDGSRNKTFLIKPKELSDAMVSLSNTTFTYNGLLQMPAVTVSDGTALTSNDYYITNEGGLDKGTYNVMVTGRNNYTGTVVRQYAINPMSINDAHVTLYQLQSYVYDGTEKNPGVREVAVGSHIVPSTSFTTTISPNINVGTVTVTVTGEKNYTGSASTTFEITPKPVTSGMITLTPDYFYYNGSVQKPAVSVKDGSRNMVENTDYTVTNEGGMEAGDYEVKVKGIGNYMDEASVKFTILSSGVNTFVVTLETTEYTFDGTEHKPNVTVKMEDRTLSEGTDYTLLYNNNVNAGTATVTVKGVGDYTGEQMKTFVILPKTLTGEMVTLDKTSFIYNEKVQKPEVTVADGTLMTEDDYTVTNEGGTDEGTYQVVVVGQNNYKGTVIKSFTITREEIHGDDDPEHPDEKTVTYTPTEEGSDEVKVSGCEGTETELEQVTSVTVPATFTSNGKTYTVVGISANAFANVPNLTDVYLPDTEEPLEIAEDAIPATATIHTTLALLDDYALMPSLSESFKAGKIMTTVTAKNRYWTFSSGVDVYVPDGVSVYIARERDNATVTIVELSDNDLTVGGQRIIKHNNGVLIGSEGNDTPYDLVACGRRMTSGTTISTDDYKDYGSQNCLVPVIVATHFGTGYYFMKNNEFYSIQEESEDIKVPAGKAVLYLRQAASSPSYSSIIQLVNTGEVTNINSITDDTDEGDWYDMSGRKLNGRPTKKGVYIKNNKKTVIR